MHEHAGASLLVQLHLSSGHQSAHVSVQILTAPFSLPSQLDQAIRDGRFKQSSDVAGGIAMSC